MELQEEHGLRYYIIHLYKENTNTMKSSTSIHEHQLSEEDESIVQVKHMRVHLFMFLEYADVPLLVLAIISTIISSLTSTALSILTGRVFDVLAKVTSGNHESLAKFDHDSKIACFSIAALAGGVLFFSWITISLWMRLGEGQQLKVRDVMYSSLFNKSLEWYESNPQLNGEIVQMNRCIEEYRSGVSECSALTLQSICSAVALIVTSLIYSWNLTLVILSSCPLIIATAWFFDFKIKKYAELENIYSSSSAKILDFSLSNPMFVRVFNGQSIELKKFETEIIKSRNSFNRLCFYSSLNIGVLRVLVLMMFVQGFWYGSYLVRKGDLTSGKVMTTFLSCLILAETFHGIAEQLLLLQKAHVALTKIIDFFGVESMVKKDEEPEKKLYPRICHGDVSFENVSFSYPSRPNQNVLTDVSLHLPAGMLTYIVGKSGSGKSTLAALLLNFYKQNSGNIRIDGFSIDDLSSVWLTDTITLVEQNVTLFSDTLKNNISLGTAFKQDIEKVNEPLLKEAVQMSLLQNLINDLPDGIETSVGLNGKSLSGGEQQRVAIARAKMRDTPILILDEATSGLDSIHRELAIAAIKQWRKGKTTIVMTHDFSQIDSEDYVFLMENGKVTEHGSKLFLIEKNEKFQSMAQVGHFDEDLDHAGQESDIDEDYFEFEILNDVQDTMLKSYRYSAFTGRNLYRSETNPVVSRAKSSKRIDRRKAVVVPIKEEEELRPEKLISLFQTFKFMSRHIHARLTIVIGLVFAGVNGVANPLFSYCFSKLLSSIVSPHSHDETGFVTKWALIVVAVIISDGISTFFKKFLLGYASESWIIQIRHSVFKQILEHDVNWGESSLNNANEISALLMNDSRDLRVLVSELLDALFTVSVILVMGLTWSLVVGWKLSLVAISLFPLFVVITALYSGLLQKEENDYKTSVAKLESLQHQAVSGIKTIKCLRLNSYFNKKFKIMRKELVNTGRLRSIGTGFGVGCSALLVLISQSIILYYGLSLVAENSYTYLQMIQTLTLLTFSISGASDFITRIPDISRAQRLSTYIIRLLSMEDDKEAKGYLTPVTNLAPNDVQFNQVTFNYPSRPLKVLQNVTFGIKRGEVYGIVGESGSGKSTISSLILKLQSCNGIYIWGTPIKEIEADYLRSYISVVSQTATFFEGSIKQNLLYGIKEPKTNDEIIEVLKLSLIYDFVVSLPQGIETQIGNDHTSLISGGQAQRISIARSLLRNPKILILDECTSALDPLTSAEVRDIIDKNLRFSDITIIIITHHEEMMRITDRLMVLKNGEVKEIGTFNELYYRRESELSKLLDFGRDKP